MNESQLTSELGLHTDFNANEIYFKLTISVYNINFGDNFLNFFQKSKKLFAI